MRVLLASWGSYGDFYPFLALGTSLRACGHEVTLVGNPTWREKTLAADLRFRASFDDEKEEALHRHPEMIDNRWMGLPSLFHLMKKGIIPVLSSTYTSILDESSSHDLLVAHHFVFPAGMVHEKTGIPWVTVCLAPGVTPSAWNQPAASSGRAPRNPIERWGCKIGWKLGGHLIRPLVDRPLNTFRLTLGLSPQSNHFFHSRSKDLTLHLYSKNFATKPPDWDQRHLLTGFCYTNVGQAYHPPEELVRFLESGDKPWLFTLGSTVVEHPREFFHQAVEAVKGTGERAILLIGKEENCPEPLPSNVLALPYAPHDWLMPRCAAVAHQCGIGTIAEALRAATPSVCCPHAFDQPNNAARLHELGVGVVLKINEHRAPILRQAFLRLLNSEAPQQAQTVAKSLRQEDGNVVACTALENYFRSGVTSKRWAFAV